MHSKNQAILALLLTLGVSAFAQDAEKAPEALEFGAFERGDSILALTLGTMAPLGFYNPNDTDYATMQAANAYPGFYFSLSYLGFLTPEWALGFDLAGSYITTKANKQLFLAPIDLRAARVFTLGSFVIAPSAGLGISISALGDTKHLDPLAKLGSSFYWRATTDVSYALNLFGDVVPQFYTDATNNRVGFFLEAALSVAYHL